MADYDSECGFNDNSYLFFSGLLFFVCFSSLWSDVFNFPCSRVHRFKSPAENANCDKVKLYTAPPSNINVFLNCDAFIPYILLTNILISQLLSIRTMDLLKCPIPFIILAIVLVDSNDQQDHVISLHGKHGRHSVSELIRWRNQQDFVSPFVLDVLISETLISFTF